MDRKPVIVSADEIRALDLDQPLPSPIEQADQLILWIGSQQQSPAEAAATYVPELSAWLGMLITPDKPDTGFGWLLSQERLAPLVERKDLNGRAGLRLTMSGWERYEALKRAEVPGRTAFIAMQFGDAELNRVVATCFRPAVERAGFELRMMTDGQPAGIIDDQIRVAIRTARFSLADLSHGNNGAYWEAGFAEGLGRPVIYTCRKSVWDSRDNKGKSKIHFDTNHLVTIIWDPDKLQDAANRLTASIRATLPGEARMSE